MTGHVILPKPEYFARDVLAEAQKLRRQWDAEATARGRRAPDAQDRVEASFSPDARKARDLIRGGGFTSLPVLAQELAKCLSTTADRIEVQDALDRFFAACALYAKEELKDPTWLLEWAGGTAGVMPPLPPNTPGHVASLSSAWTVLIDCVNRATKTGIEKPHREHPVRLKIDLEQGKD